MSGYEKHIGKLKKVDLSKYDNSTEKFFEEYYRKLVTDLSEEKIKDEYSQSENYYVDYKVHSLDGQEPKFYFKSVAERDIITE